MNLLETCEKEWQEEWRLLLGLAGGPTPGKQAGAWVRERWGRIPACLPASHEDLPRLAEQL